MVNVSIWSTIEQSIGIICACLITYRPLLARMRGKTYSRTTENLASQGETSKSAVEMSNRRFGDADTAHFARLSEDHELYGGIKTDVTATPWTREFPPIPRVIVKAQTIEQYHDDISPV